MAKENIWNYEEEREGKGRLNPFIMIGAWICIFTLILLFFLAKNAFADVCENKTFSQADIFMNITGINNYTLAPSSISDIKGNKKTISIINLVNATISVKMSPLNIMYSITDTQLTGGLCYQGISNITFNNIGSGYIIFNITNFTITPMLPLEISENITSKGNITIQSGKCESYLIFNNNEYLNYTICAEPQKVDYEKFKALQDMLNEILQMENISCTNESYSTYFIESRPELQGLLNDLKSIKDVDCNVLVEDARSEMAKSWLNVNKETATQRDACYDARDSYKKSFDSLILAANTSSIELAGKLYDCEETKNLKIQEEINNIRDNEVLPRNITLIFIGFGLMALAIYKWRKRQGL